MPIKNKKNNDQELFQIGGAIIGGMYGGPGGALAGSNIGSQISNFANQGKQEETGPQPLETAMSRRKAQLDQTPLRQIRESIDSLKYVNNDAMRMELAKPLVEAEYMAKMKG